MKKIGILIIIMLTTMIVETGCGCKKKEKEEIKVNTEEEIIKDQKVEVFEFTNTSLVYENGTSTLETTVTNTSKEKQFLAEFKIHVKDEKGNIIVTLTGFIGDSIEAGSSKKITSTYGADLTKATKIEYEIVKE